MRAATDTATVLLSVAAVAAAGSGCPTQNCLSDGYGCWHHMRSRDATWICAVPGTGRGRMMEHSPLALAVQNAPHCVLFTKGNRTSPAPAPLTLMTTERPMRTEVADAVIMGAAAASVAASTAATSAAAAPIHASRAANTHTMHRKSVLMDGRNAARPWRAQIAIISFARGQKKCRIRG